MKIILTYKLQCISLLFLLVSTSFKAQNREEAWVEIPDGSDLQMSELYKNGPIPETVENLKNGVVASISYKLKTKNAQGESQFLYNWTKGDKPNYKVNNPKENGQATVNVFFVGLSPNENARNLTAKHKAEADKAFYMSDFMKEILVQNSKSVFNECSDTLKLFIISKTTLGVAGWNKIFGDNKSQFLTPHSTTCYLVWDEKKSPSLPSIFTGIYNPITIVPLKPVYSIYFESNNPMSLPFNSTSESGITKPEPLLRNGITKSFASDKITSLTFTKSKGINLIISGMADTTDFLNDKFEIKTRAGITDTIEIIPISYTLIYIDPFKGDPQVINRELMEIVQNNSGPIFCYLSFRKEPIIIRDRKDAQMITNKLITSNFEPAFFDEDLKKIYEESDYKVFEKRMNLNIYLIVLGSTYDEYKEKFNEKKWSTGSFQIIKKNTID